MGCRCQYVRDRMRLLRDIISVARDGDGKMALTMTHWLEARLTHLRKMVRCSVHEVRRGATAGEMDAPLIRWRAQRNNSLYKSKLDGALKVLRGEDGGAPVRMSSNPLYEFE